jgi:hypothetical protein
LVYFVYSQWPSILPKGCNFRHLCHRLWKKNINFDFTWAQPSWKDNLLFTKVSLPGNHFICCFCIIKLLIWSNVGGYIKEIIIIWILIFIYFLIIYWNWKESHCFYSNENNRYIKIINYPSKMAAPMWSQN